MNMKKNISMALAISALTGLLALAGCDTPVGDEGYWLAEEANPFIGTWGPPGDGMTAATKTEFKTDGTFISTTPPAEEGAEPEIYNGFYLVKDDILVISQNDAFAHVKYRFTVIDNNTINVVYDRYNGSSYQNWVRTGEENPDAVRTTVLTNNFAGSGEKYWRKSLAHRVDGDGNEASSFMYDWWIIKNDGTLHGYHYMYKRKDYIDRGESAYFYDTDRKYLTVLSPAYSIIVYKITEEDWDADPYARFKWQPSYNDANLGASAKIEEFDGETFFEKGHTAWH
jgi:hypothetical protein